LNPPDPALEPGAAHLPRQPRDDDGPVFAELWHAQVFALAVKLSEAGWFTWPEWAAALGAEFKAAAARGAPDDGSRYYGHWLAALEKLAVAKGLTDLPALSRRKRDWVAAYEATPHGQPVKLGRGHS